MTMLTCRIYGILDWWWMLMRKICGILGCWQMLMCTIYGMLDWLQMLMCRIYGMMSGLSSGNGASANGQPRKQKQSTPAVDPEILGADTQNDPWKQWLRINASVCYKLACVEHRHQHFVPGWLQMRPDVVDEWIAFMVKLCMLCHTSRISFVPGKLPSLKPGYALHLQYHVQARHYRIDFPILL